MRRPLSILASGAAAVALLTSAMVPAQVQQPHPAGARDGGSKPAIGRAQQPRLRTLSNQLRPTYRHELMRIRAACGLTKEQFRKIRPEFDAGFYRAVVKIDSARDGARKSPAAEDVDYSAVIREEVLSVVQRHVTPERWSACHEDLRRRAASRKSTGVDFLVAIIDRELLLTGRQRRELVESLSAHWDDRWCDALELALGGHMVIPKVPDRLVAPYLSALQQETWRRIPRFQNRLWGVAIDHGGDPEMEQEIGADPTPRDRDAKGRGAAPRAKTP